MNNLRFALGILVGVALFWGVTAALAQTSEPPSQIRPTVIDIQQAVPVLAEIEGTTVPFTVDIALRIDLSGPVTASMETAPTPVVEMATETPRPSQVETHGSLSLIALHRVHWRLIEAIDTGGTFNYLDGRSFDLHETTQGKFGVLHFDVENNGQEPADLYDYVDGYDYEMRLVDSKGRSFAPYDLRWRFDSGCEAIDLNPGISAECYVVFELPESEENFRVEFVGDSANQSIDVRLD